MGEDIIREAAGEIIVEDNKEVMRAIGKKTVELYKELMKKSLEKIGIDEQELSIEE